MMEKSAYPMGVQFSPIHTYDLKKWIKTFEHLRQLTQQGHDSGQVINHLTADWEPMEKQDFQQWMKFYEEQAHNKYKNAQDERYFPVGGGLFPFDALKAKVPELTPTPDAKEEINRKIRSIVSRLNAAERLATDPEVQRNLQQYLDIGVVKWLEELQRVKRLIQVVPLRHAKSATLTDIIMKCANEWELSGFPKTAQTFRVIAQEQNPQGDPTDLALDEIIKGMNPTEDDEDVNEVRDLDDDPLATISIKAQEAPVPIQKTTPVEAPAPSGPAPESAPGAIPPTATSIDMIDAALDKISLPDVIVELEALANIFRNREISRKLAKIDLMMNALGIASFFPSLAEANQKSLESNQYALSRIEDILSKLRGATETPDKHKIDLGGETDNIKPIPPVNSEAVKRNLEQEQAEEKARKERRKEQENEKLTPEPAPPMPPATVQPGPLPSTPTG